jgi:dihydroxyacetone kinase-like protein
LAAPSLGGVQAWRGNFGSQCSMTEIGFHELNEMLRCAADEVIRSKAYLSELDAFIGDGDHGTTVARSMDMMLAVLEEGPKDGVKTVLRDIGWAILGVDGGATGPLLGSLFKGLSEGVVEGGRIDSKMLAVMFKRAQQEVMKISGAAPGDKTMIDALAPAVTAITANEGESDLAKVLQAAAEAANQGAEATIQMRAKKGRARHMSERTVGHKDPGASSMALIFRGLAVGAGKI